jgi:hypothetical protein
MKISEFDKLEKKINGQNFHESYKTINKVMIGLSYFGHLASIFLAFFMLSNILFGVMENKPVVWGVTIIVLSAIELLKRDVFHKFSILYLKLKAFTKDVLPLFFLSITIIGISFYSSIKGAGEYASKGEKIESDFADLDKRYEDSITKAFQPRIDAVEEQKATKEKALTILYDQQSQLNNLGLSGELTSAQKKLLKSIPSQIKSLEAENKPFIDQKNAEINGIEKERDEIIKKHHEESKKQSGKKKEDNSKNSVAFVIFSTLIEISILAGVYFGDYYDVRSYREKKEKIEKDPNFIKWKLYSQLLDIIYTEDTKMNQKLPPIKSIIEMCKMSDIIVLQKDVSDFLKIMATVGIVKVSGSTRYISKQRDAAFEALKKHYNID